MSRRHELLYAMNAGGVDPEAVARVDMEKLRLAGEHPVANLLPRVLGPATIRPGSQTLADIPGDAQTRMIPLIKPPSEQQSYCLLLSAGEMRIGYQGVIQQVPAVSTVVDTSAWTDASTAPADMVLPGSPLGLLLTLTDPRWGMTATSTVSARMRNVVTVAGGDQATTHVLRVVVERGSVVLRIGTTAGGQELLADAELETGTHKLAFVPGTATVHLELRSDEPVLRLVSTVQMESSLIGGTGDLVLPTPWTWTQTKALRKWQSIDTLFLGDGAQQQRRIEHRGPLSWGISLYKTDDGPFSTGERRLTMTPAALSGNTTVTASESYFRAGHVGALLELTQTGKTVSQVFDAADQTSDYVTIIGVDAGRYFYRTGVDSAFIGTLVLERSFDAGEPLAWTTFATYINADVGFARIQVDDTLDNLIAHYRFRVTAYTSGSCTMTLDYESGIQTGRARITDVSGATKAHVEVLTNFGNTTATRTWRIGSWSDVAGWPRVPVIHDSRMSWLGPYDRHYAGDARDDYYRFDDDEEGDSAPFTRTLQASGVNWGLSLDKLLVGTPDGEAVVQASELDEPLSPTRYTVRWPSRRGVADIEPGGHDDGAFFAQRSRRRLYEISVPDGSNRFASQDVSRLNPAAYRAGIAGIVVQQQPDTRVYAWLDDGTASVLTFDRDDKVAAVTTIGITGGLIESMCVLPETDQDDVYLIVNRSGQRTWERLAKEADQYSKSTCALLDGHKVLANVSSITGGTQWASQTVQVWADGQKRADVTLNGSGVAALGATYARVVYGKRYTGVFKSVKLAHAAQLGTALGQTKKVHGAGLILHKSCLDGIRIGRDADNTDPMPAIVNGAARTTNQLFDHYDADIFPINSDWDADARVYVSVDSAEGPCTIQAIVLDVETRDGAGADGG